MPPTDLDNAALADLLSYMRRPCDNDALAVDELEVLRFR